MNELVEIDEAVSASGLAIDGLASALANYNDAITNARDDSE